MVNERCFNGSVTGCTSTLICFLCWHLLILRPLNIQTLFLPLQSTSFPRHLCLLLCGLLSVIIIKPKYHSHSHIRSMISCFSCVSFPWRHTVTAPSSPLICCCICFATAPYYHWSKQTKKKKNKKNLWSYYLLLLFLLQYIFKKQLTYCFVITPAHRPSVDEWLRQCVYRGFSTKGDFTFILKQLKNKNILVRMQGWSVGHRQWVIIIWWTPSDVDQRLTCLYLILPY